MNNKVISGKELFIKGRNKLNRNEGNVKSGCGVHKSEKDYSRKIKHKHSLKENHYEK
jgi:hypothetical protein